MYIALRYLIAFAATAAVANGQCAGEDCIREDRSCTGKEDLCCDGFDCFGFHFFKKCQAPPACLHEWYDCEDMLEETGDDPCCPGFVCAKNKYNKMECVREVTQIGSRTVELPGKNAKNYVKEPPKPPLNCKTTSASPGQFYKACLSGDPHITTFNKLTYDCQGVGEHILFMSKVTRRIAMGRFRRVGERDASVMRGLVIQDEGCEEIPKVQLTMPELDGEGGISTELGSKGCQLQLFVNDAMYDLSKGYEDDHVIVEKPEGSTTYIIYKESKFRAKVTMGYWNGCLLNACFDVPKGDEYVGLLGHAKPGGKALADWVTRDGKTLEVPAKEKATDRLKEPGYNYCTKNWCLHGKDDEAKSLFKYNEVGHDFGFYSRCSLKYRTSLLEFIDDVDQEILDFCEMDLFCIMDALEGGIPAARQARFNKLEMKEGTECGKEEATCAGGCCDGFECVKDDGPESLCMPIKREKPKCKKRPLSKCSDSKPCCEGMECLKGRCRLQDQECVPEDERVYKGVNKCCNGLKPYGRGKRKVCKKLKDKSKEDEPCDDEQKCEPGFFCKRGNCKKKKQKRKWGEGCKEFDEDHLNLDCEGNLKCFPWKGRKVCQDRGGCGKKYATNCDVNPCCPDFECVKHQCEETGKLVLQCQPKGQKEARDKNDEKKGKEKKKPTNEGKKKKEKREKAIRNGTCKKSMDEECKIGKDICCNPEETCQKFVNPNGKTRTKCKVPDPNAPPPKPDSCVLKRGAELLRYSPNFPEKRPDVYVEARISDGRRFKFFPKDFPDHGNDKEGEIPFANREIFQILYDEQQKLGGQGFELRYVSKNGPGGWNSCKYSPIALDINGSGKIEHTKRDGGFKIDITGDGDMEHLATWFAPTEGILIDLKDIADPDDNVADIITGHHLLGDQGGTYGDGYDKLATYDDNGDDKLSGDELQGLYLWVDENSNLLLDKGELKELSDYNITALSTTHDIDMQSKADLKNGGTMLMQDVWFNEYQERRRLGLATNWW